MRPSALGTVAGRAALKAGINMMRTAMPDATRSIDEIVAEGDIVMVCSTLRGTHTGGPWFDLPASGTAVQWASVAIYPIAAGKLVEERVLWDRLGAFQQLGLVPSQAALFPFGQPMRR
jgi:predicted ester cyclase